MRDLEVAWVQWLDEPGPRFQNVTAEDSAADLIARFRQACTPQMLVEVCVGQFFKVVGGKVVREDGAKAAAEEFRAQGYHVRTERADDLGPGVACVRVTAMRRRPNLLAFHPEDACRFGRVAGNPQAGLALGRSIFQPALMTGRASVPPAVGGLPVVPAGLAPSDTPAPPAATPAGDRFNEFAVELARAPDLAPTLNNDEKGRTAIPTLGNAKQAASAPPAEAARTDAKMAAVPVSTGKPPAPRRGLTSRPRPERATIGYADLKSRF
jgi:hypothetical protein